MDLAGKKAGSEEYAELLEVAGVGSVPELALRNAPNGWRRAQRFLYGVYQNSGGLEMETFEKLGVFYLGRE